MKTPTIRYFFKFTTPIKGLYHQCDNERDNDDTEDRPGDDSSLKVRMSHTVGAIDIKVSKLYDK